MTETSKESRDEPDQSVLVKDPRYNKTSVSAVTEMECMLIAAYGQEHDPETKATPKEKMDGNEILTKLEAMKLSNEGGGAFIMIMIMIMITEKHSLQNWYIQISS